MNTEHQPEVLGSYELEPVDPARTAVVIANGPSLRGIDLKRFSGFRTFGMNAAYRHWRRIDWWPEHYACLDEVVGLSHASAIAEMIADHRRGRPAPSSFCLRRNLVDALGIQSIDMGGNQIVTVFEDMVSAAARLFRPPVTTGSHTLLWALSLGYKRVFLVGADASYVEVVPGAQRVDAIVLETSQEADNPNYFFDDYQQPGDRYHLPNIGDRPHLRSWRVAASGAAELDSEAYNLSPGSRVDALDFADLDDLIAGRTVRIRTAIRVAQARGRNT